MKYFIHTVAVATFGIGIAFYHQSSNKPKPSSQYTQSHRITQKMATDHAVCSQLKSAGQIQSWKAVAECMNDRNIFFLKQIDFAHIDLFTKFSEGRLLVYAELDKPQGSVATAETATAILFQQFLNNIEKRRAINLLSTSIASQ